MKTYTTYVTDDGLCFTNREKALKHENDLNKEKIFCLEVIEHHAFRVYVKAKSEHEAHKLYYEDPNAYEKKDYEIDVDSIEAIYDD